MTLRREESCLGILATVISRRYQPNSATWIRSTHILPGARTHVDTTFAHADQSGRPSLLNPLQRASISTVMMRLTGYLLAADPAWIELSVTSYYPLVSRIIVSYDERGLGWTGIDIPVQECL